MADRFSFAHFLLGALCGVALGKILDPLADKCTQGAVIICLTTKYRLMRILIVVFVLKEIIMAAFGFWAIRKKDAVNSAQWYGKLNTVVLYAVMSLLILFPGMPGRIADILIVISGAVMIMALALYTRFYIRLFHSK